MTSTTPNDVSDTTILLPWRRFYIDDTIGGGVALGHRIRRRAEGVSGQLALPWKATETGALVVPDKPIGVGVGVGRQCGVVVLLLLGVPFSPSSIGGREGNAVPKAKRARWGDLGGLLVESWRGVSLLGLHRRREQECDKRSEMLSSPALLLVLGVISTPVVAPGACVMDVVNGRRRGDKCHGSTPCLLREVLP